MATSAAHATTRRAADPADTISATFESGVSIQYKLTVGNSGAQPLTGVTVADSTGATGCAFTSTWAVGYANSPGCTYNRTAPNVPTGQTQISYANVVTVDANEILPEQDSVTVAVQPPPPNWKIDVYVSPFALGDDGDGAGGTNNPDFKNVTALSQGENAATNESVWFQVVIQNIGGSQATGVTISSTLGAIPFNQNNPNQAVCPVMPTTMNPGAAAAFTCRYKVDAGTPGVIQNTVTSTRRTRPARSEQQRRGHGHQLRQPVQGDPEPDRHAEGTRAGRVDRRRLHRNLKRLERPAERDRGDPDTSGLPVHGGQHQHDDRELTMTRLRLHRPGTGRGQALVEFALVLPIFAIMLFGIIDFGRYVFTANSLNNGAREAARFASVSVFPAECTGLTRSACATTIARSHAWGVPGGSVNVTTTCEGFHPDGTAESRPRPSPSARPVTCCGSRPRPASPW